MPKRAQFLLPSDMTQLEVMKATYDKIGKPSDLLQKGVDAIVLAQ